MDASHRPAPSRVLVVDDCPDTLESLGLLLRLWGFDALTAPDGESALEQADSYRPAVVLLDLTLTDMDGFELTRRLRAGGVPTVVAVSGWVGEEVRQRCLDAGCHLHLCKPVEPGVLRPLLLRLAGPRGAGLPDFTPSPPVSAGS